MRHTYSEISNQFTDYQQQADIEMIRNYLYLYPHANDHLRSNSVLTDQSGSVVEATAHDPWGEVKTGGTKSKFLYTGQEKDLETNLNYYNARYYDSHIRRFTQPDDYIQNVYDPQSLNRYSYVRNNPLKYTDPSGKVTFLAVPLVWWAVGAFLGAGAVYTATPQGKTSTQAVVNTVWNGASQLNSQAKNIGKNITNTFNNKQTTPNNSSQAKSGGSSGGTQPKINTPQIKNFDPSKWVKENFNSPEKRPQGWKEYRYGNGPNDRNYYNPKTGESLSPDLQHGPKKPPHWDFKDVNKDSWRILEDGTVTPK